MPDSFVQAENVLNSIMHSLIFIQNIITFQRKYLFYSPEIVCLNTYIYLLWNVFTGTKIMHTHNVYTMYTVCKCVGIHLLLFVYNFFLITGPQPGDFVWGGNIFLDYTKIFPGGRFPQEFYKIRKILGGRLPPCPPAGHGPGL